MTDLDAIKADRIAALEAEVARLREALTLIIRYASTIDVGQSAQPDHWVFRTEARIEAQAILATARAALSGEKP